MSNKHLHYDIVNNALLLNGDTKSFNFSFSDYKNIKKIIVKSDSILSIVGELDILNSDIELIVEPNSVVTLKLLSCNLLNIAKINVNVYKNAQFSLFFLDFCNGDAHLNFNINLIDEYSAGAIKLASLAFGNHKKYIEMNINHLAKNTNGLVDAYGICKDCAKLHFLGQSHIFENATQTFTIQNARIMILDSGCDAVAKPILKIDNNDVKASHSASIGEVNQEHIFYLTSRGLKYEEAKKIIILGYFNPIVKVFDKTSLDEKINALMTEKV